MLLMLKIFFHKLLKSLRLQQFGPLSLYPFREERGKRYQGRYKDLEEEEILQEQLGRKDPKASTSPVFSVSHIGELKQGEKPVPPKVAQMVGAHVEQRLQSHNSSLIVFLQCSIVLFYTRERGVKAHFKYNILIKCIFLQTKVTKKLSL